MYNWVSGYGLDYIYGITFSMLYISPSDTEGRFYATHNHIDLCLTLERSTINYLMETCLLDKAHFLGKCSFCFLSASLESYINKVLRYIIVQ